MVVRPPIEKWSRDELEEQYCKLFQNNYCLKNKYNDQESKLKQCSARLQRYSKDSDFSESSSYSRKYEELQNQNRILHQKLQLTKQQLLRYARPSSRLSRRSSPNINKQNTSPKAHSPFKGHKLSLDKSYSIDKATSSQNDTRLSSSSPPISQEKKIVHDGTTKPTIEVKSSKTYSSNNFHDKISLIKLNKQLHEKTEEVKALRWKFKNLNEQLEKLRAEHDRMVEEYEVMQAKYNDAQYELQIMQDKIRSLPAANDNGSKIEREETEMLRKEVQTLKEANEKLIQNSLMTEPSNDREKELLNRIGELESSLEETKTQQLMLVRELEHRTQEATATVQKNQLQLQQQQPTQGDNERLAKAEQHVESEHKESDSKGKFFDDMRNLINSHISNDIFPGLNETEEINKWKNMYMEIYAELEKTRNMLLVQHNINQQHLDEVKLVSKNCEHYKLQYEQKLSELMERLEEKDNSMRMLENQMKLVAYSSQKPLEVSKLDNDLECEPNEMILQLQKIVVSNDCLKELGTLHPNLFLSIEFFDFELQTTPIFYGTENEIKYTTIYDVVVSNLFVHYIATEGILIELYHSQGASYKLCAVGSISLSAFLSNRNATKLSGSLNLVSPTKGLSFASLFYDISVKEELLKALILQKKRSTAGVFCALTEADADEKLNGATSVQLIIQVHRCNKLDMLTKDKLPPSSYVIYEFYDFHPSSTEIIHKNANPEFNSTKVWALSNGPELIAYLRVAEICFAVMEEILEEESSCKQLGYVIIPLYPLSHNNPIIGTFLINALNKEPTVSTLDVSIYFKYALTEPLADTSTTANSKQKSIAETEELVLEEDNIQAIDAQDKRLIAQNIEPEKEQKNNKQVQDDESSAVSDSSSSTEISLSAMKTPKLLPIKKMIPVAVDITSESNVLTVDKISANQNIDKSSSVADIVKRTEEARSVKSRSSLTLGSPVSNNESSLNGDSQAAPDDRTNSGNESSFSEHKSAELPTPSEAFISPQPQPRLNIKSSLVDKKQVVDNQEEAKKVRPKIVEFKEPPHESISFSGESNSSTVFTDTSESEAGFGLGFGGESGSSSRADIPLISASKAFAKPPQDNEPNSTEYSITLTVENLFLSEDSPLLSSFYNNFYVTIEWKFLDFSLEECETRESLPLARESDIPMEFNCDTSYILDPTRIKLLSQWMELGNRLEFVIVGTDSLKKSDDLGVALLDLRMTLDRERHVIRFYDINNVEMAKSEVEVKYSKKLGEILASKAS